jgi:AcrR family transcriptional regulator
VAVTAPDPEALLPKHAAKRRQIIEAAQRVLARDGLAACTARAVADESPLTKSAIHYYFQDMDEIVDAAMAAHLTAFLDLVRAAADRHTDPAERLWAAVRTYLETFSQQPSTARLWFAYWVDAGERSRTGPIDGMHHAATELLASLLADIPVANVASRAHALLSYLLGTVVQQAIRPLPFTDLASEIAGLCGPELAMPTT